MQRESPWPPGHAARYATAMARPKLSNDNLRAHRVSVFFSAAEYCLGDKAPEREEGEEQERKQYQEGDPSWARQIVSDRVAWTQTLNLSTDDPYKATRMMAATVSYAPTLKQRAEVKAGGRELAKPVCHYSLSWK